MQITGGIKFRGGFRINPPVAPSAPVMPNIGSTWTYQAGLSAIWDENSSTIVYDVAWDGSKFVAVTTSGRVATSPDGVTWTNQTGLSSTGWSTTYITSINWNGSQFLVAGGTGKVATSPDGVTWTYQTGLSSTAWSTTQVNDIHWNGSQYLIVGNSGKVATSPDGVTWTNITTLASVVSNYHVAAVAWDGTRYVAVSQFARNAYSTDNGATWTSALTNLSSTAWGTASIFDITYGNGTFLIGGATGKIATSTDGATWTAQGGLSGTSWGTSIVYTVYWTGSQFFAGGDVGKVAVSTNGVTWTYYNTLAATTWAALPPVYAAIVDGTSKILVTGSYGRAATSTS